MATPPKRPGVLADPWRTTEPVAAPASAPRPKPKTKNFDPDPETEESTQLATIDLKGYGAITVADVSDSSGAASKILEFAIDNRRELERHFTEYGIIIVQMSVQNMPNLKFYIQRSDGWMLAIPNIPNRDVGCFQLIQALLHIKTLAPLKKKLEEAKISAYKF